MSIKHFIQTLLFLIHFKINFQIITKQCYLEFNRTKFNEKGRKFPFFKLKSIIFIEVKAIFPNRIKYYAGN